MKNPPPLRSKVALAATTLCFAQEEFQAADAISDAALQEVASFAAHAKLWQEGDVHTLSALNTRAFEAEELRRHAMHKLVWEFCEAVRLAGETEAAQLNIFPVADSPLEGNQRLERERAWRTTTTTTTTTPVFSPRLARDEDIRAAAAEHAERDALRGGDLTEDQRL